MVISHSHLYCLKQKSIAQLAIPINQFSHLTQTQIFIMEVEAEAIQGVQPNDQTDHRKEYLCADLLSLQPRSQRKIPPPSKSQKKGGAVYDSLIPRIIKGTESFYYILKRDRMILIYEVYPNATCFQFNFEVQPIGLHIFNRTVYFLTGLSSVAIASLLNNEGPAEQIIPTLGRPLSLFCGYPEDGAIDMHGESNMVLKIAHWNRKLEVYELGRQSNSWLSSLLNFTDNLVPYDRLIVLQPNVLGCAIVNNSLRFINLHTKNTISSQFYITFPKVNCQKIQILHCSRVNFIKPSSRDHIQFLLGYFIYGSSTIFLYKVTLSLQVMITEQFVYLDQLAGNLLLDDRASIELVMEMYLPQQRNELRSVVLTYDGISMVYQEDSMAIYTSCQYRSWNNLIQAQPTELLDSAISKLDYEDNMVDDEDALRNRIVMPDRFPYGLLYRQNSDLYTRLKSIRADQLHSEIKNYTKDWATHYRLLQLLEFRGVIFGIRVFGISILTKSPSYFKYYYENFTKVFERMTKQKPRKSNQIQRGDSLSDQEHSIASRFSTLSLYERLGVSLDSYESVIASDQQLSRSRVNNEQDKLYTFVLKELRRILSRSLQSYEGGSGLISQLAANLALSQTRHHIMVITELLCRLYPQSRQDMSYDDRRAIRIIFKVNKLLQNNFDIFSRTQIAIQRLTETPVYLDLLILFSLMTIQQNNSILFTNISESTNTAQMLIRRLLGGIVWLHSSYDKLSYTRSNELINFACELANEPLRLEFYIQQLAQEKCLPTSRQLLLGCAIARNYNALRQRLFQLPSTVFESEYDNIIGLFKTDKTSLQLNNLNARARAIVQSVKLPKNPQITTANQLISETNDSSCKKALRLVYRNQVNQAEIRSQWDYLRISIAKGRSIDVLEEILNKKDTRISQILSRYRKVGDHGQTSELLRGLFQVYCQVFNRIQQEQHPSKKILEFVKMMKITLEDGLTEYSKAEGQSVSAVQSDYLDDFNETLYGKIPTRGLISLLEVAQLAYFQNSVVPFRLIPRHVVFQMMKSNDMEFRRSMMSSLLQYFTNREIATQIVAQAQPGQNITQQVNALGYAPYNYAKLANKSGQASQLLAMLSNAQYRCAQRQICARQGYSKPTPTMK